MSALNTADEARVRPLRADAQRNRALILEAAERVLARSGVSAPIDEVAREAGVGVGTMYRHFPTKEALLEAVLVSRLEGVLEEARAGATAEDPGAAFFRFLEHMVDVGTKKHDLAEALSRAGIDVESRAMVVFSSLEDAVRVLLARAQDAGAVRTDVGMPELFGLLAGTCMIGQRQDRNFSSPERLLSIVCDGLRPPTTQTG